MLSLFKKNIVLLIFITLPSVTIEPPSKKAKFGEVEKQLEENIKTLENTKITQSFPNISARDISKWQAIIKEYVNADYPFNSPFAKKIIELITPYLFVGTVAKNARSLNAALSPDQKIIALGSSDKSIRLWDTETNKQMAQLIGHTDAINAVRFSPDGNTLASASNDETIKLWDIPTTKLVATLSGHKDNVNTIAFSPGGQILASGSDDGRVILWEISTGKQIAKLFDAGKSNVNSVAFSPDGKTVAAGSNDYIVRIWDIATHKKIAQLSGHTGPINAVAFSPDGKILASGSSDKTIRLWDVATYKQITQLFGHGTAIISLTFSPDSKILISGSEAQTVKSWNMQPIIEFPPFIKSLYADATGVKKFFLLHNILENYEETKKPFDLQYNDPLVGLLKGLPIWLKKALDNKNMVKAWKKVGASAVRKESSNLFLEN